MTDELRNRIRHLIRATGLTYREIAHRCNCTLSMVSRASAGIDGVARRMAHTPKREPTERQMALALAASLRAQGKRYCNRCATVKPLSAWNQRQTYCRLCEADRSREYRKNKLGRTIDN